MLRERESFPRFLSPSAALPTPQARRTFKDAVNVAPTPPQTPRRARAAVRRTLKTRSLPRPLLPCSSRFERPRNARVVPRRAASRFAPSTTPSSSPPRRRDAPRRHDVTADVSAVATIRLHARQTPLYRAEIRPPFFVLTIPHRETPRVADEPRRSARATPSIHHARRHARAHVSAVRRANYRDRRDDRRSDKRPRRRAPTHAHTLPRVYSRASTIHASKSAKQRICVSTQMGNRTPSARRVHRVASRQTNAIASASTMRPPLNAHAPPPPRVTPRHRSALRPDNDRPCRLSTERSTARAPAINVAPAVMSIMEQSNATIYISSCCRALPRTRAPR